MSDFAIITIALYQRDGWARLGWSFKGADPEYKALGYVSWERDGPPSIPSFDDDSPYQRTSRRRMVRLAIAKKKGTHSKDEWLVLHDIFERCVACGIPYEHLNGGVATKDHIEPIYAGGCDCIGNLQPVCRNCNSAGIVEDLRGLALPGWSTLYLHKMGCYY